MAPLADAMRLVHREQAHRPPRARPTHRRRRASRSGATYSSCSEPVPHASSTCARARRGLRAVERGGGEPRRWRGLDLVLHQREERRHDHREPVAAPAPAPGSRPTCRRRWAAPRGCRGRPARTGRPGAGQGGSRRSRSVGGVPRGRGDAGDEWGRHEGGCRRIGMDSYQDAAGGHLRMRVSRGGVGRPACLSCIRRWMCLEHAGAKRKAEEADGHPAEPPIVARDATASARPGNP